MPDYYLLPEEIDDLQLSMKDNPECTFIAKPSKGKAGKGIKILKKFSELPKAAYDSEYLIQRYIEDPLLVNGKKFDVRLYLLVCGVEPMQVYLCDEGIARFCTHNYKKPDATNLKNVYMHLTNYSVNKKSQRFKLPGEEFRNDDHSHKQLFTNVLKNLMNQGKDIGYILQQIKSLSQRTIIALEPYIKNAYHCFISTNHSKLRSFQILGLDVLIDEAMHVWLVELNANPSLNVYNDSTLPNGDIEQTLSELDKYIKTSLITDTLKIVTTPREIQL